MDDIARDLIAVAKEMTAIKSEFTVIKTLQLKKEGATRDSLENARRILAAGYDLLNGTFAFNRTHASWTTTAFFRRPSDGSKASHVFKGYSFGYGGEGPSGMYEFLDMFGWGPDKHKIMDHDAFDEDKGVMRLRDLT